MRKRILAMIFAAFMVTAAAGCGNSNNSSDTGSAKAETTQTEKAESKEAVSGVEGDLGDYHMRIKKGTVVNSEDGDMLRVVISFTNNSEETTSYLDEGYTQAFQNGVQLEDGLYWDGGDEEYDNVSKDIRPGVTIDVAEYFALEDTENPVDVEVSEFMSTTGDKLTKTFDLK